MEMAETPAIIQRDEKDFTRVVSDMWPALDYLARRALGNARRQALWPIIARTQPQRAIA